MALSPTSFNFAPDSPLHGLKGAELVDNLRRMQGLVMDVETTGLLKKDFMYSAGLARVDLTTGSSPLGAHKDIEYIFDNSSRVFTQNNPIYNQAEAAQRFRDLHSSKYFGQQQLDRHSLDKAAYAHINRGLIGNNGKFVYTHPVRGFDTNVDSTFGSLKGFLDDTKQIIDNAHNGTALFTHNSNFEERQLKQAALHSNHGRNKPLKDSYNSLAEANVQNPAKNQSGMRGLVGGSEKLSFNGKDNLMVDLFRHLDEAQKLNAAGDTTGSLKALDSYVRSNVAVINELYEQSNKAVGQAGKYVPIDSMHLFRAFMAFGALNGDVDIDNLRLGGSVESQMKVFLGNAFSESHEALDDARHQGKIASMLLEEIGMYSTTPGYSSVLAKSMNDYINNNNIHYQTFSDNIKNEITNYENAKRKSKKTPGLNARDNYATSIFEYLSEREKSLYHTTKDTTEHTKFLQFVRKEFDSAYQNKSLDSDVKLAQHMDAVFNDPNFSTNVTNQSVGKPKGKADYIDKAKKFINKHPVATGMTMAGVGLYTVFGGDSKPREEIEYNTFDSVYGQYYGVGFADWQNANNAHKVLY